MIVGSRFHDLTSHIEMESLSPDIDTDKVMCVPSPARSGRAPLGMALEPLHYFWQNVFLKSSELSEYEPC